MGPVLWAVITSCPGRDQPGHFLLAVSVNPVDPVPFRHDALLGHGDEVLPVGTCDRNTDTVALEKIAGIGNSTMNKLANNENVTMEIMVKICTALDCKLDDIVDIIPDDEISE